MTQNLDQKSDRSSRPSVYRIIKIHTSKSTKSGKDYKAVVGIVLSLISVGLSLYAVYRSHFYRYESLYVSTTKDKIAFGKETSSTAVFKNSFTVILINRGTTSIAITNISNWLNVRKIPGQNKEQCANNNDVGIEIPSINFRPIVLKSTETVALELQFESNPSLENYAVRISGGYLKTFICSDLRIVTIGMDTNTKNISLSGSSATIVRGASWSADDFWGTNPQKIIEERRFF